MLLRTVPEPRCYANVRKSMQDDTTIVTRADLAAASAAPSRFAALHPLLLALHATAAGSLDVTLPDGRRASYIGTRSGVKADIRFKNWECLSRIAMRGDVGLGESYMEGAWDTSDLDDVMEFGMANMDALRLFSGGNLFFRLAHRAQRLMQANSHRRSRRNVHRHYDLGNDFYRLWLDEGMTYSCALFNGDAGMPLQAAQQAKYRRILDRLQPKPRSRILEIGCGWGGFMEEAARQDCDVVGITLSPQQAAWTENRLARQKLGHRAEVWMRDYREVRGAFDHIVSIGMFEHVGREFWPGYMRILHERLKPGADALIQCITVHDDVFDSYMQSTDFLREYIFPGGTLPCRREFVRLAERAGLAVEDVFEFGSDYALTLDRWRDAFESNLPAIRRLGHDDAFIRKWRFYLSCCAAAFRAGRTSVMQVHLRRP